MNRIDVYNHFMNNNNINISALDLNLITALSALLELQSVSLAAESVGRTQSAMSHSLSRLREHFHDPILVRDGWTMQLTPMAEQLRPRVADAARAAQVLFELKGDFDPSNTKKRIRIATPDLCISLFTGLVDDISRHAPGASIEFVDGTTARQAVLNSDVDIALAFGHPKSDTNLILHQLAPLSWCTFAPIGHNYCTDSSAAIWESSHHIVVGLSGSNKGPVERAVFKAHLKRHVSCYASNFLAALGLAAATGALFTTLRAPMAEYAKLLGMIPCPPPFTMPDAPASLIFQADYGDPFSIWLRERCLEALS